MATKIAINGFGRIGRDFIRAALDQNTPFDIVAINDLSDTDTMAHLLQYDTVGGILDAELSHDENSITVNGDRFEVLSERDPALLPWQEMGVDIVIESTGKFTKLEDAQKHIDAGAKKVIISAPGKNGVPMFVVGVNDDQYDPETQHVISNASCTTNCLAPLAQVFHENFGIESGMMTTVHAYTGDQNLQDGPHKDQRRARAAAQNIVPTSTGAAKAIGKVLPELDGKLQGSAYRVPVINGSLVDLIVTTKPGLTVEQINAAFQKAADTGRLKGVMQYSEEPLVSSDILHNDFTSIFDAGLTDVNGTQVRIAAWYDNEWGYSQQLVRFAALVGEKLG